MTQEMRVLDPLLIPLFSDDGRFVTFDSDSGDLVSNDSNFTRDVFIYDRTSNTIKILSVSENLEEADDYSSSARMSANGTYVVFESNATNLVAGDTNGQVDIFFREINDTPTNILLSQNSIDENKAVGAIIGTLSSEDLDAGDTHTYSISCVTPGDDDASFTITGDNLKSSISFNYEQKNSYEVCIRSNDSGGGIFDKNFTININDVEENNGSSSSSSTSIRTNTNPQPILGCTDNNAKNYNESATENDNSCEYYKYGCTDSAALNYDSLAEQENNSCIYYTEPTIPDQKEPDIVYGCTEKSAKNYNELAEVEDGSCLYPAIVEDIPLVPNSSKTEESKFNPPSKLISTIAIGGAVLSAALVMFLQPGLWLGFISVITRLWTIIPALMGYQRKKRPWGTVYDSITKQPLDPAYVILSSSAGQEIATSITDLDGRYGFLVEGGNYQIKANKANYEFPSKKLSGKTSDDLYENLYFGEQIELNEKEAVIYKNIPMDAVNFNWNEFEKSQNKKLMKFYSRRDIFLAHISQIAFVAGFISSVILFFISFSVLNIIILSLYALVLILRIFGIKPKQSSYVFDSKGYPLSFGLIKLFSSTMQKEVAHTVIGKTGKYYLLVPNGNYQMKISKKTGEDSYQEVFTKPVVVKGGYLKEKVTL
ncbi:MAG: hypothetical protein R3B55_03000 [Candidatus Paceibacterota bacterium]